METEFKHVPSLVVGLGGTGNEIARRLKTKFAGRYPQQETLIRYLVMDTDRKSFRDGFWDREEQVFLRLSLMPRHILSAFYQNEYVDWLPQEPRINPDHFVNQESGAGLIRPIGRLYFQDQVAQVRDRLEKAKNSLSDLAERLRTRTILGTGEFQVYIVGSLAGGTGCGAFLDIAALVRDLFEENSFLTGLFTLYPCYAEVLRGDVDQARRSKANCYAALKELEFFMQEKDETQPHLYLVKFWDGASVSLYKRLFNICYLVENTNDSGAKLCSLTQIYELCAQQLFHEIASPLGEDYRSKINNLSFFQSGLAGEEWREWGRKRRFSSFGNVSFVFNKEKLLNYCVGHLTKEVAEQGLHGTEDSPATSLLSRLGISGWYDRPPLLEDQLVEYADLFLDYRIAETKPAQLDEMLARRMEEVERGFTKRLDDHQLSGLPVKWRECLKQEAQRAWDSGGIPAVKGMFVQLDADIDSARQQWSRLLEHCRQDLSGLAGRLAELRTELRSLNLLARISRGKVCSRQVTDTYHAWLDARSEKDMAARLLELLSGFAEEIKMLRRQKEHWCRLLADLRGQAVKNLNEIVFQVDQQADPTVLVLEAITEPDCEKFYREHLPADIPGLANQLWQVEAGDLPGHVQQACLDCFQKPLAKLSLVQFLRTKFGEHGRENWNLLLDQLREICRPFWTARLKHGEYYNQTCLVGLAVEDGNFPPEVVSWAKDRSDATRGIDCVNTYYPDAIDISVCCHGAYAGYLNGIKDYYLQYEQFLRNKEFPVHLHEQFRCLPELDPYRDTMGQSFALAGAYGVIAENSEGYFFALSRGHLGWEYRYKTQAAIKPANWEELRDGLFTSVPRKGDPSWLGMTRAAAQASLAENSTYVSLVNTFVQERIGLLGRDKVQRELEEYAQRLLCESGEGGQRVLNEVQSIKIYLGTQLNREKVYG